MANAGTVTDGRPDLGGALGMSPSELDLLGELFVEVLGRSGIEATPIFERLRQGNSIGEALAVPAGVISLLYARAHRWFAIGRPDRAESLFRVLCILDGDDADNWVGWGICLRIAQNWDQALIAFETAARLRPAWAVPHFHALELHIRREAWDRARASMGRFERLADASLPNEIRDEVARFQRVLTLRAARAGGG